MSFLFRILGFFLIVFVIGGIGGVVFDRAVFAWLAQRDPFARWPLFQNVSEGVTVVRPTERVVIDGGDALRKIIEQAEPRVGMAVLKNDEGVAMSRASGAFVTSEGGFLTRAQAVIDKGTLEVVYNGTVLPATLLSVDAPLGIALVRVEGSGFPVVSFAEDDDLRLGDTLFALYRALGRSGESETFFRPLYLTRKSDFLFGEDLLGLETLPAKADGAAVFTSGGKIAGMLVLSSDGSLKLVSAKTISGFLSSR